MHIALRDSAFDPWGELLEYQRAAFPEPGRFGATAAFVGSMRDFNDGYSVSRLLLEYYPGMTEGYLEKMCVQAAARWELLDTLVLHRVGEIDPGEPIVLVAAWSAHRAAAFDACRSLMEELKSKAPFWKKETVQQGQRWVARNTRG